MSDAVGDNVFEIFDVFWVEACFLFLFLRTPPPYASGRKKSSRPKKSHILALWQGQKSVEKKTKVNRPRRRRGLTLGSPRPREGLRVAFYHPF